MKSLAVSVCALGLLAAPALGGGSDYYYLDSGNLPWGDVRLEQAMNTVFGGGGWTDENYNTVNVGQLLSGDTGFIYLEGSDGSANELADFVTANQADLENWVSNGGTLFINAAPNEGGSFNMGFGVTLNYPDFDGASEGHAVDPAHPIFNGPFGATGADFTGNSFSHATVSGAGDDVIHNGFGNSVLGEFSWGDGFVMAGGMTSPMWQDPNSDALRANIISHVSGVIPAPGAFALLGLAGLSVTRRRRR